MWSILDKALWTAENTYSMFIGKIIIIIIRYLQISRKSIWTMVKFNSDFLFIWIINILIRVEYWSHYCYFIWSYLPIYVPYYLFYEIWYINIWSIYFTIVTSPLWIASFKLCNNLLIFGLTTALSNISILFLIYFGFHLFEMPFSILST